MILQWEEYGLYNKSPNNMIQSVCDPYLLKSVSHLTGNNYSCKAYNFDLVF